MMPAKARFLAMGIIIFVIAAVFILFRGFEHAYGTLLAIGIALLIAGVLPTSNENGLV